VAVKESPAVPLTAGVTAVPPTGGSPAAAVGFGLAVTEMVGASEAYGGVGGAFLQATSRFTMSFGLKSWSVVTRVFVDGSISVTAPWNGFVARISWGDVVGFQESKKFE